MLYACFRRNTPPPSEKLSMLSPPQFFKFPLFDDRFQWKSVLSSELLLVWVKQMSFVMKYLREKNWWRTENHYRSVARGIRRGWNLIIEDLIFMAGGGNFDITQDLKLLRLEKEYVRSYYVRFRQLCCISFSFVRFQKNHLLADNKQKILLRHSGRWCATTCGTAAPRTTRTRTTVSVSTRTASRSLKSLNAGWAVDRIIFSFLIVFVYSFC